MRKIHTLYSQITSLEHLFQAWDEFKKGKSKRKDVQYFEAHLEDNLFLLQQQLEAKTYQHSSYTAFNIYDPKFRHIHKAEVKDRIVHHSLVSVIEPYFDKTFIYDSYSCRVGKGTHRAVKRLFIFIRKVSKNYTGSCFALKLDIKKFFENVDHAVLLRCIRKRIQDEEVLWLLEHIIKSFSKVKGMPIGNLTSQLFANIYLNELDLFVKHRLRIPYYLRYADDFVILASERTYLESLVSQIDTFLNSELKLQLHGNKVQIRKYTQGIDFLGYICLPHYVVLRTKTRRRMFNKLRMKAEELKQGSISQDSFHQTVQSYIGFLKHASTYKLSQELKNSVWFWIQ